MEKDITKMLKLLLIRLDIEEQKQKCIMDNVKRFYEHQNKAQEKRRDIQF